MKTENADRIVVFIRMPEDLRDRIKVAARQNFRSVTAEINYRLRESLEASQSPHESGQHLSAA